jgi:deazaflavin-dependent oxidoreductase (nitroreductase family)
VTDWNASIIAEFRAHGGRVGGRFADSTLLLLHTTGARSGQERVNPVAYLDLGDGRVAVFASFGGQDVHPAGFHNLVAHPDARVETGEGIRDVRARVTTGDERAAIWERQKDAHPGFARYETRTSREIPVVVLEPR